MKKSIFLALFISFFFVNNALSATGTYATFTVERTGKYLGGNVETGIYCQGETGVCYTVDYLVFIPDPEIPDVDPEYYEIKAGIFIPLENIGYGNAKEGDKSWLNHPDYGYSLNIKI